MTAENNDSISDKLRRRAEEKLSQGYAVSNKFSHEKILHKLATSGWKWGHEGVIPGSTS